MKIIIKRNSQVFGGMSKFSEGRVIGALETLLGGGEGEIKFFAFEERLTITKNLTVEVVVYEGNEGKNMPRVTEKTAGALQKSVMEALIKVLPARRGIIVKVINERKVFSEVRIA